MSLSIHTEVAEAPVSRHVRPLESTSMRRGLGFLTLAFVAALSCGGIQKVGAIPDPNTLSAPTFTSMNPSELRQKRVVVVAIDGVRWQEIFQGTDPTLAQAAGMRPGEMATADELVPNIRALGRRGVALGDDDHPFEASGPNFVSLPGYTELLTGRVAPCQENDCNERPNRTIVDDMRGLPDVSQRDVAVITSWERIDVVASGDPSRISVSAGRSHGETRGLFNADPAIGSILRTGEHSDAFPGHDDYRPDRETAALATTYFERVRPRFMFVALGDTDEFGHENNYRSYVGALRRADSMVGELTRTAKSWGPEGDDVVFFVVADHGRCKGFAGHGRDCPESSRSWMVAGGGPIQAGGNVASVPARYLRDIAPTVRAMMGLAADTDGEAGVAMRELLPDGPSLVAERN